MSHTSSSKKRKTSSPVVEKTANKKAKYDSGKSKKDKGGKGKSRDTEFQVVQATLLLSIAPVFASNPRAGVNEMLDSMIMRYIPALQGVVLAHSNLSFLDDKASIKADLWSPSIGMTLEGRISVCSPDHISILVQRTFNVSIPRHHIPLDWEFEYGPADNDPEFGPDDEQNGGRWVHKTTREPMGKDTARYLQFTVIGLTVANEMLSVVGSLQPDPFSPAHSTTSEASQPEGEDIDEAEEEALLPPELDGLEESDDEDDPFDALGKSADVEIQKEKVTAVKEKKKQKRKAAGDESQSKKKSKRRHIRRRMTRSRD
ncbi:hypothetical protein BDZ89DRAFT_1098578 [Hymenopellis radicata]|nr:hypothetical protein BDZ89DRAFT_1098578 [Hymenopellis radicata]